MDRKTFDKLMTRVCSAKKDFFCIINSRASIIKNMIDCPAYHTNKIERGHMNLIVGMEELAELQQEISKALRGKLNRNGLIEEMIDVEHTLMCLKDIYNISEDELNKARYIKAKRINERIEESK